MVKEKAQKEEEAVAEYEREEVMCAENGTNMKKESETIFRPLCMKGIIQFELKAKPIQKVTPPAESG